MARRGRYPRVFGSPAAKAQSRAAYAATAGAVVLQKLVPVDANSFYIVAPYTTGGAIAHRYQRNVGASADSTNLGGSPSPAFRVTGTVKLNSYSDDPVAVMAAQNALIAASSPAPLLYSSDTGAVDFAFFNTATGKWGGSFHALGTGSATVTLYADGVAFTDITVPRTMTSFSLVRNETIDWGGGNTCAVVGYTESVGVDGAVTRNSGTITASSAMTQFYPVMGIGTGNFADGKFRQSTGDQTVFGVPVGERTVPPPANRQVLRNPDTGRMIQIDSNASSAAGFSRSELIRAFAGTVNFRSKIYQRFAGTPSGLSGITSTTTFLEGATGAQSYAANTLVNPTFDTDLAGWTSYGSASAASAGKARMTSDNATQKKLAQQLTIVSGGLYMFAAEAAGDVMGCSLAVGRNTNGSTSSPTPFVNQSAVVGLNINIFVADQTGAQPMLLQGIITAGLIVDWDNTAFRQLQAA